MGQDRRGCPARWRPLLALLSTGSAITMFKTTVNKTITTIMARYPGGAQLRKCRPWSGFPTTPTHPRFPVRSAIVEKSTHPRVACIHSVYCSRTVDAAKSGGTHPSVERQCDDVENDIEAEDHSQITRHLSTRRQYFEATVAHL